MSFPDEFYPPGMFAALHEALLSAYTRSKLKMMLRFRLDKSLDDFVKAGATASEMVFEMIEEARREGWLEKLVEMALEDVPGNPLLIDFKTRYPRVVFPVPTPTPSAPINRLQVKEYGGREKRATSLAKMAAYFVLPMLVLGLPISIAFVVLFNPSVTYQPTTLVSIKTPGTIEQVKEWSYEGEVISSLARQMTGTRVRSSNGEIQIDIDSLSAKPISDGEGYTLDVKLTGILYWVNEELSNSYGVLVKVNLDWLVSGKPVILSTISQILYDFEFAGKSVRRTALESTPFGDGPEDVLKELVNEAVGDHIQNLSFPRR